LGMDPLRFSILLIAIITVSYTVIGGLKAVIYTDTIQWIVLLVGLIVVTIPFTLVKIGGFEALRTNLPHEFFTLNNIGWKQVLNWMVTIIPIWLIGMTLYQRMYACKDVKEAKKAWYIAGIFEYPVMAFAGVFLGMCARVVFPAVEAEMAMPMLISHVLPIGVTGIVIAAYFSAIMSTADSCLMASSGNIVNDIIQRHIKKNMDDKTSMRWSMVTTLIIGITAVLLAAMFTTVLDAILYAYAFMVSGLFIPTLGAYFWKRSSSAGAFMGIISGGGFTLVLMILEKSGHSPLWFNKFGLDAAIYGIAVSLLTFVLGSLIFKEKIKK